MMSILDKVKSQIDVVNPEEDLLYKKWNIQHRDELFTNLYWSHHPATEKYFFEGNPAFYYEYKNNFDMGRYPISLLRDGFIGILEFFLLHPKPHKDINSILLVHKKFEKIIPKSWVEQVAVYELEQTSSRSLGKEFLFIYGTPTEQLFIENSPENLAKEVSEKIKDYQDYLIYCPVRDTILSDSKNKLELYYIKFLKEIYRYVGFEAQINFHEISRIQKMLEGKSFDFFNLDKTNFFIADNYLDHSLYSMGGRNVSASSVKTDGLRYNLSGHHQIIISEPDFTQNCFSEFYYQYKIGGQKTNSIYEVFRSDKIRKLFFKNFSKNPS